MALTSLKALSNEAELTLPLVACKEKKRLDTLVTRSTAWVDKATSLFVDAMSMLSRYDNLFLDLLLGLKKDVFDAM
jgi:hypothetical protein